MAEADTSSTNTAAAKGSVSKAIFTKALLTHASLVVWRNLQPGRQIKDFHVVEQAAACGHRWLVEQLLDTRVRPEQVPDTALAAAISSGDLELVRLLMRRARLRWQPDSLVAAIRAHSEAIVQEILASGEPENNVAAPEMLVKVCEPEYNHLHKLIMAKWPDAYREKAIYRRFAATGNLEMLVKVNPELSFFGMGFIHSASQSGHVPTLEYALRINPESAVIGSISLPDLAHHGHLEMIKFVVERGLVNLSDATIAAKAAAGRGHVGVLAYLLETGRCRADTDFLRIAARHGQLASMEHLLNCGVRYQPEVMDEAAVRGHLHVVEWLAERFPEGCTSAAMRTPFKPVLEFLTNKYPGLASPSPWSGAKPAFQPSWGAAQPAFQVASTDADEDTGGDGDHAEDEDVNARSEWDVALQRMGERLRTGEQLDTDDLADDFIWQGNAAHSQPPTRKQKQRAKMHSGFKTAPAGASNPECKQS